MTDETPRCEPPPELRGHDWFHWLEADAPTIGRWYAATDFSGEAWRINSHQRSAQGAHRAGYRYVAPVTPPEVVRALVEALTEATSAMQAACERDGLMTDDDAKTITKARAALAAYRGQA